MLVNMLLGLKLGYTLTEELSVLALFTSTAVSCSRVWEAPKTTVG